MSREAQNVFKFSKKAGHQSPLKFSKIISETENQKRPRFSEILPETKHQHRSPQTERLRSLIFSILQEARNPGDYSMLQNSFKDKTLETTKRFPIFFNKQNIKDLQNFYNFLQKKTPGPLKNL